MVAMKTSNEQYQHSQSSDRDFKIIISNIRHTIMHTHEYCWDHCFKCMTLIKFFFWPVQTMVQLVVLNYN